MCCLFGIINYGKPLKPANMAQLLCCLSISAEQRGQDATGIAYNYDGEMRILKKPLPAHKLCFNVPNGVRTIMGHTRLTTQGSETKNYNNHPFRGQAGKVPFAFAHNGVLQNDIKLRESLALPKTVIETDSFIGVQIIESQAELSFRSLGYMAETVIGSFVFTLLDKDNNVYFIKGDNPLCLYHYPEIGLYLYASTQEILAKAISWLTFDLPKATKINVERGAIIRIDASGKVTRDHFKYRETFVDFWYPYQSVKSFGKAKKQYSFKDVDILLDQGFSPEEIEDIFYSGLI